MPKIRPEEINRDGLEPLLMQFNSDKEFLRFAIKNVYFMDPIETKNRWEDIKERIRSDNSGIIRYTPSIFKKGKDNARRNYIKYVYDNEIIQIKADWDGNKEVRNMFKEMTGILASYGKRSKISNYTLTHIWGLTDKPYTYPAPWNIALTSTFIAPLTDGDPEMNSVRYKFQSTFRAIGLFLYVKIEDMIDWIPNSLLPEEEYKMTAKKLIEEDSINIIRERETMSNYKRQN